MQRSVNYFICSKNAIHRIVLKILVLYKQTLADLNWLRITMQIGISPQNHIFRIGNGNSVLNLRKIKKIVFDQNMLLWRTSGNIR